MSGSKPKQRKLQSFFTPKTKNDQRGETSESDDASQKQKRKLKFNLNVAIVLCAAAKRTRTDNENMLFIFNNSECSVPATARTTSIASFDLPSTSMQTVNTEQSNINIVPATATVNLTTTTTTTATATTASGSRSESFHSTININLNIETDGDYPLFSRLSKCVFHCHMPFMIYLLALRSIFVLACESDPHLAAPSDISKIGEEQIKRTFENVSFPKTANRRFKPIWIQKYAWIEYSVQRDAVFCYACRQFTTKSHDEVFTVKGFRNWKTALAEAKGLNRHDRSNAHISAMASWRDKVARKGHQKEISVLLSSNVLELRRYYVESILDIVIFLSSNELAFRGNWDMDLKKEDGLFQSMFEYTLKKDIKLQQAVKIIPKNATYTSPDIQNELIAFAVLSTREAIVAKVNSSDYFALYVDGTKDRNGVFQSQHAIFRMENHVNLLLPWKHALIYLLKASVRWY